MANYEIHSNMKYITSGNIPTLSELPKGNMAFGKMTFDNKYHIYGNFEDAIIELTHTLDSITIENFDTGTSEEGMLISPSMLKYLFDNIEIPDVTQSLIESKLSSNASIGGARKAGSIVGLNSVTTGIGNVASGTSSYASGSYTEATEGFSHSEGYYTKATRPAAHAEGYLTVAGGSQSHAEGFQTKSIGQSSHAEGWSTQSAGEASHAEGIDTESTGYAAHAEGQMTIASGQESHAEGVEYRIKR